MLKEMPKKGDKVRFIKDTQGKHLTTGGVYEVVGIDFEGDAFILDNDGCHYYIRKYFEFDEFEIVQSEESPRNVRDLIVELAYNYVKLAQRVEFLEDSLEEANKKAESADGKAEMLIDDVVMLDERTQSLAGEVVDDTIRRIQESYE